MVQRHGNGRQSLLTGVLGKAQFWQRWADVPMNWTCPECGARKEDFEMVEI